MHGSVGGQAAIDIRHDNQDDEARFRALLDALPAAIYTTDADGTVTFFNRAAADLAGREPQVGKDKWCVSWRLRRPDGSVLPHEECPMAVALKERRSVRGVEIVAERPDGRTITVLPHPTPIFSQTGTLTGGINMLVDVSGRKEVESALQREIEIRHDGERAASHLAAIVESSDDAIISKDLSGIITTWNRGAERLFGYTAAEIVGQPVTVLFPPDRVDEEAGIIQRIRRGERVEHFDTVRRRKDGADIDISLTISPIKDPTGAILGASKIARDISERRRAESDLARRMQEQTALYRLTERLHRAQSLPEMFDAALDAIVDALDCDRASILLFDGAGVMRFVGWRGLSDQYRGAVDGHSPWQRLAIDPAPIFVTDIEAADFDESLKSVVAGEGISALGFIPLITGGRLIGKFMTYHDRPHAFTLTETNLALTIARQLAYSVERIRETEARRDSETRLQMALEAGRMGAWEWDLSSGSVIWSPGLEELHGLEPGSFGGTVDDVMREIHPDDVDRVRTCIDKALETREDYHVAYRMNHPDGSIRWLEAFGRFGPAASGGDRLAGVCMDVTARKDAESQRDLLVAELSHRVKNTLSTVISIARQSFATNPDSKEAQRSFNARIRALGQTHSRLAESNWSGVALETLLLDELAPYRHDDGGNVGLSGPLVTLSPKQALTLGMAAHELATNAAKYGALSSREGRVNVRWDIDGAGKLRIEWAESGGPEVLPPSRDGFGRFLIDRVLASDLGGEVETSYRPEGVRCIVRLPLGAASSGD
jgi:PAS domain S-box-containing protein